MGNVTIMDIAREAGVSKATVSRVLNRSASVDSNTRERVEEIIRRKRYSPSTVARNLANGISSIVGIIIPEIDNPFFGELLRGASSIADKNDLTLMCFNSDDNAEKDYKALKTLKDYRVRGMLYTPATDYDTSEQRKTVTKLIESLDIPVILMDREPAAFERYDGIFFEDRKSMYEATEKLILAGHKKIGIINATLDRGLARIRQAGYREALEKYGIPYDENYCYLGDYSVAQAYRHACEMLDKKERPTAVVTCNNNISMGFLKALQEHDMKIAEDIVCIGLDKIEALDIVGSGFNYIRRDAIEMGKRAMEMLIRRMAFPMAAVQKVYLDSEIVIRKL